MRWPSADVLVKTRLDDLEKISVDDSGVLSRIKGESINGVMYVCNKEHVKELLGGTGTEVGRIGYVALTRARNLFVLAVPASSLGEMEPKLVAAGFQKAAL